MARIIIESDTFEKVEIELDPEALRIVRARPGLPVEASIDHMLGAALISRMLPLRASGRSMIPIPGSKVGAVMPDPVAAEAGRCAALAITKVEEATMFAVKAHTAGLS